MNLDPGLVIAGKYRIEHQLAAGGMGSLWVARHLQLEVPLAVKFMDPANADSPVAQQRFEREARSAANLRSMHIVHVQDYGVTDGIPYIVMELLHGEDLGRRLKRMRRLPLAQASTILTQAAKGLRRAHEAGVVHRDLKPANIFLARIDTQDDEEIVKLLDFGVAKEMVTAAVKGESTRTGELVGSPHYMSPEQIRGAKDLDYRSDLWSMGVILFRAVTGALPFTGDSIGEVMAKIIADPIPLATHVAPDLPFAINTFFERAFARERERRFQSAREMSDAFAILAQAVVPTQWTGEFQRPQLTPPLGSPPQWSLSSLQNLSRPHHPAHAGEQSVNYANSVNSWGGPTPTPGYLSSSAEFTPAPPSISHPGYGLSTPGPGSLLAPSDGSLGATGGSFARSLQWSPAWFGAVAGLSVVGIGLAFFALRSAPAPEVIGSSVTGVDAPAPMVSPSDSTSSARSTPPATQVLKEAPAPTATASARASAAPSTSPASSQQTLPPTGGPRPTVVRPTPQPERLKLPPERPAPEPPSSGKKKPPAWGF